MEESTSLCSNCQRPIAASNFVIHSLHCQRNLTKCEKCGEAVPRSALDEHESEFHSKVNCPDCHLSVERQQLETHKKTLCISRQQHCQFCELELPASEMYEHENYCGSRTKKCEECGEYVMLKYEQLHIESNHGFLKLDDEPGPIATWIKNDLESGNSRPPKSNNNQKPQLYTGKFDTGDDGDDENDDMHSLFAKLMKKKKVIAPAAYPGVAYPISDRPQRTISRSPPPYQEVMDDSTDLVALPCEFCEAMIPVNQLILHQTACRMDITSFGRSTKSQNESSKKNYSGLVINDSDNEGDEEDEKLANHFPEEIQKRRVPHTTNTRRNAIDGGNTDSGMSMNSADRKTGFDEGSEGALKDLDDDGVYLPCEFCGDGYPPSLLLEHQDVCEYHPKSFREVQEVWPEDKDGVSSRRPQDSRGRIRSRFDEASKDADSVRLGSVQLHGAPDLTSRDKPDRSGTLQQSNDGVHPRRKPTPLQEHGSTISYRTCSTSPNQTLVSQKLLIHHGKTKEKFCEGVTQRDEFTPAKPLSGLHDRTTGTQNVPSLSSFYSSKPQSSSPKHNSLVFTNCGKSDSSHQAECNNRRHPSIPEHTTMPIIKFSSQFQPSNDSGARGKSNISNSYNDLRGNFTVASEWSDDSDSRPTSATGAIPKQKAGKLNIARKINQEVQSTRSTNPLMANHSRLVADKGNVKSLGDRNQRYQIHNNLKDQNGDDDDDDDV